MNCYCDYEPSDVWVEKVVKARKPWKCCECRGGIKVGETYHRTKSLYDGQWATYRTCCDCEVIKCDITKYLKMVDGCWCPLTEAMTKEIINLLDHSYDDELKAIVGAFNAASKERGGTHIYLDVYEDKL